MQTWNNFWKLLYRADHHADAKFQRKKTTLIFNVIRLQVKILFVATKMSIEQQNKIIYIYFDHKQPLKISPQLVDHAWCVIIHATTDVFIALFSFVFKLYF